MCVFLPLIPVKPTRHIYSLFLPSLRTYAVAFAFCRLTRYALCVKRDAPPCTYLPGKKLCCVNVHCSRALEAKKLSRSECVSHIRATYDTKHEDRIALLFHLSPPPLLAAAAQYTPLPLPPSYTGWPRSEGGGKKKPSFPEGLFNYLFPLSLPPPPPTSLVPREEGRVGGGGASDTRNSLPPSSPL